MMEKILKIKLLTYTLISAITFTYLILPYNAGISVPIFVALQFACLYFVLPKKKPLWLFIPIFILALNAFISGNTMWRVPNFIVILILYCIMILLTMDAFPIQKVSFEFVFNMLKMIFKPFKYIGLPFKWLGEINHEKAKLTKRIFIGILITIPCLLIILMLLSSADTIFSIDTRMFFRNFWQIINLNLIWKIVYGLFIGLYLFSLIYMTYIPKIETKPYNIKSRNGDLIILNILLFSILIIYSFFVIIQFRYLFAGGQLPNGLTFTEYARKGFFELIFLSGINIFLILLTVGLTRSKKGKGANIIKFLCSYLCFVTIILLVSSFYRMWLYSSDYGLTRLRFLVFGFLIFESIGLMITFFYIIKPAFNIVAVYLTIGLVYYLIINIVPIDHYIAKNQVDRYLNHQKAGIDYVLTLSTDAAPEISRLYVSENVDYSVKAKSEAYLRAFNQYIYNKTPGWQSYNLANQRALHNYSILERNL